jgi:hypothetical protein
MPVPTEGDLRREFHALCAERDRIALELRPLEVEYNAMRAKLEDLEARELKPLERRLRAAREASRLHEIKQQIALISRALGGRTGDPPETA